MARLSLLALTLLVGSEKLCSLRMSLDRASERQRCLAHKRIHLLLDSLHVWLENRRRRNGLAQDLGVLRRAVQTIREPSLLIGVSSNVRHGPFWRFRDRCAPTQFRSRC